MSTVLVYCGRCGARMADQETALYPPDTVVHDVCARCCEKERLKVRDLRATQTFRILRQFEEEARQVRKAGRRQSGS